MRTTTENVMSIISHSVDVKLGLREKCCENIIKIADEISQAFVNGNKVLICGNGGSAADAQHFTAELAGKFMLDRPGLPAIALTTNTSNLTAIGNDFGFEDVFQRQVDALAKPGDVVIGISTSGNSPNVVRALNRARSKKCRVVSILGRDGGVMKNLSDIYITVPSLSTARIQEAHIMIIHIICELVEKDLFEK